MTFTGPINTADVAVAPQLSDTLVGWQPGQTPHTRQFSLAQIVTLVSSSFLPLAGGTVTGATTFSSGANPGLTVSNNAVIGGALGVTGAVTAPNFSSAVGANLTVSPGGNGHTITFGDPVYGIGIMGSMAMGASASAASMVWNGTLQSQFFRTPGFSYTLSGSSGSPGPIGSFNANWAGTFTGQQFYPYFFTTATDAVDAGGGGVLGGFGTLGIAHNYGTGSKGGRTPLSVSLTQTGPRTGDTSSQQMSAVNLWIQTAYNSGGTGFGTSAAGSFYGANPQILLHSGATFYSLVNVFGEGDYAIEAGASADKFIGRSLFGLATHATAANAYNIADVVANQIGAASTLDGGYIFGLDDSQWPMASGATLVGTRLQGAAGNLNRAFAFPPQLATYGVDWQKVNFSQQSGGSFRGPGFLADGAGQVTAGNRLLIGTTSTGAKIDIPNTWVVQSVAVNAAGNATGNGLNSYFPGDLLYGTSVAPNVAGQYKIATTQVLAAQIVSGGSGGTNGAQTVTGTTGTGTKFQASVTVSGGAITAVNSISLAGSYTVNPVGVGKTKVGVINAEPVTGASLVGATLNLGMGALTVSVLVADVFSTNITAITPTGGSGAGLTLTATNAQESTLQLMPTAGGLLQIGPSLMTANGSVATAMSSLGPAGSHTTIQEWLTVTNASGVIRYIPAF